MQINLFTCTAERNRVNKDSYLTNRFVMDGSIKNTTSTTNINILVEKTNPVIYKYNYMYIEEFGRYYFINDIVNVNANMWEIHAQVDVLQTFKNDIKTSYGVIDKYEQQNDSNVYFDDGSFIMDARKDVQLIPFANGFNDNGSYILICAGGI